MGYYVFPIAALTKALSLGGMVVGTTLIAFGLYGAILWEKLNLSLLLVGGYLIVYAHQNRSALQLENLYALLQERQPDKKRRFRSAVCGCAGSCVVVVRRRHCGQPRVAFSNRRRMGG